MARMLLNRETQYQYESEESAERYAGMHVSEHGDYLCIQWWEHPVHVYKRLQPDERVHPFTSQVEYQGKQYRLEWIEDEKEHATSPRRAA
jgi:hypothetical protein